MARIYKQKTKTKGFSYYFTIELGKDTTGKRNRIKRGGFTRRKDAEKAALELEAAALSGKIIKQNTSITLHYFMWNVWLEYHRGFVKQSTAWHIESILRRIDCFFSSDVKLVDVTPQQCHLFIKHMFIKQKLSRRVVIETFNILKAVFTHAIKVEKILSANPCENLSIPRYSAKEKEAQILVDANKILYIEKDDLEKFFIQAKSDKYAFPYYTISLIMLYTGMRIGEVFGLQWEDIDFENNIIHIRHDLFCPGALDWVLQTPKSKSSIRDVLISDKLALILKSYRKQFLEFKLQSPTWDQLQYNFIFSSFKYPGQPLARQNVYWWVTRIAKKINALYIQPHLFRHTHVSLLAEAGVPLPVITERLGHASTKITEEIYFHITKTTKENYFHKFNRIVENL